MVDVVHYPHEELSHAAGEFLRRKWSFFPVVGKVPVIKWGGYKRHLPSERDVRNWFRAGSEHTGIAIVPGKVSGHLACRDFDNQTAWKEFYDSRPEIVDNCPVVITPRGAHVYCRAKPGSLQAVRRVMGCEDGCGAITLANGELRADVGCYSLAPPSVHPNGTKYFWMREPTSEVPVVDLTKFISAADRKRAASKEAQPLAEILANHPLAHRHTCHVSVCLCADSSASPGSDSAGHPPKGAQAAIAATLPSQAGQRNGCLFKLARKLKAIPALASSSVGELRPYIEQWHKFALPTIGTKEFQTTWGDFVHAWNHVKQPEGKGDIDMAFQKAISNPLPASAAQYESPQLKALVALCKQLQLEAGTEPFFLAGRVAAELVQAPHRDVARWLQMLVADGVIALVTAGKRHRAAEYQYIGRLK